MIKLTVALHNFVNGPKNTLPLQVTEYQLLITQRKTGLRTITSMCFTPPMLKQCAHFHKTLYEHHAAADYHISEAFNFLLLIKPTQLSRKLAK
jgi:hypothetical protein